MGGGKKCRTRAALDQSKYSPFSSRDKPADAGSFCANATVERCRACQLPSETRQDQPNFPAQISFEKYPGFGGEISPERPGNFTGECADGPDTAWVGHSQPPARAWGSRQLHRS